MQHSKDDLIQAHRHCTNNRGALVASTACGCFYCMAIFAPGEVTEWIDDDQSAICPHCGIDSVIAAESGLPVTKDFLEQMHNRWF